MFLKYTFSELFTARINRFSFNADSEYDISFEPNRSFLTKHRLKRITKCTKAVSRNQTV